MFGYARAVSELRWRAIGDPSGDVATGGQGVLFDEGLGVVRRAAHGAFAGLEVSEVLAKRVLNRVPAGSRMPFRWTINPYRGCSHACRYCFARPSHTWLGLGAGEDFERRLVVKVNAPEVLARELSAPSWRGEEVALGTNTDPYQPIEGRYRLTRRILAVLAAAGNPFSIVTKSTLILGDLPTLVEAGSAGRARVSFSIGTLDEAVWRETEPSTPHPRRRVEALRRLAQAGVPVGVLMAPVLPGLSDRPEQLRAVVEAVVEAGACWVGTELLHLRPGVAELWREWLTEAHPELVADYASAYGRRAYLPERRRRSHRDEVAAMVAEARRRQDAVGRDSPQSARLAPPSTTTAAPFT